MLNIALEIKLISDTELGQILKDAKELAIKLDVAAIMFNFNGYTFAISQKTDLGKILAEFTQSYLEKEAQTKH